MGNQSNHKKVQIIPKRKNRRKNRLTDIIGMTLRLLAAARDPKLYQRNDKVLMKNIISKFISFEQEVKYQLSMIECKRLLPHKKDEYVAALEKLLRQLKSKDRPEKSTSSQVCT